MNKKVVLSVLATAVVASMAASAFAAPKQGLYIGGNVKKFYSTSTLLNMTKDARTAYKNELKTAGFQNLVFVNIKGQGATIKEMIDLGTKVALADPLKQSDFLDSYGVVQNDGTVSGTEEPGKHVDPTTPGELKVESVSAINPLELQVKYSKAVDETSAKTLSNYVITVNGNKYGTGYLPIASLLNATPGNDVAFDEEKNTVTFRLATGLANGAKYSIDVTDGVLSADKSTKVGRHAGEQQTFSDTATPQLVKAEVTSSNFLKLTFNEPVTGGLTATVDGVSVALAPPSTVIGTYTVQSAAVLPAELRKAGAHSVSVYNATDVAAPNANSKNILTGSFQVTGDTTPPAVVEVKQVSTSDRAFDIKFSETVTFDPTKLVIKKGNFTFPAVDTNSPGYTLSYLAADKLTPATAATATYARVTFGADSTAYANNLYGTGENSVNLEVTVENYKDGVNLVGAKDTKTVTLAKNLGAPAVTSKYDNAIVGTLNTGVVSTDGALNVKFDKALNATVNASKITVVDKDGVTRTLTSAAQDLVADATGKTVKLVVAGLTDRDDLEAKAPFTVSFAAGAVKGSNNIENAAFSTQVEKSSNTVSPVTEAVTGAVVGSGNVLTVTYNTAVDASAANLANYTLDGAAFPAGTTISINGNNTVVTITLPEGYTNRNITKLFEISKNVKTANGSVVVGSVATKAPYSQMVSFTDNTKPVLTAAKFLVGSNSDTTSSKIKLSFSENVSVGATDPTADFAVTVNGSAATVSQVQDGTAGDEFLTLVTSAPINLSQPVVIKVNGITATNTVVDVTDGTNALTTGTEVPVSGTELDASSIAADAAAVATDKAGLTLSYNGTGATVTLPGTGPSGTTITWSSADTAVISNTGAVTPPAAGADNAVVNMTATITKGTATDTKVIPVTVIATPAAAPVVVSDDAANTITLVAGQEFNIGAGWVAFDGTNAPDVTGTVTVQVRVAATATKPASEIATVNFTA